MQLAIAAGGPLRGPVLQRSVRCYRHAMVDAVTPPMPQGLARIFSWRRLKPPLITCAVFFLIIAPGWHVSYAVLAFRLLFIALVAVLAFGVLERWPARLPAWAPRWALQV